jgi:hypothetical protein
MVEIDGGLEGKNGDTMHWWVLLTEDQSYIIRIGLPGTHTFSKD